MGDVEPGKPPRALLVDDDAAVQQAHSKALRKLGFETIEAADGAAAARLLGETSFDVILSDLEMPHMGGIEFLRSVRQHDLDVPVILITGQPALDTAVEALEHGAFRYLRKPVVFEELRAVVQQAVAMHRLARLKREALALMNVEGRQLGDRASLDARFSKALDQLSVAFQPIVIWPDREVFGYEALVRSAEPSLQNPADLLDAAERLGRQHDLGRLIRSAVARSATARPGDELLFVNVDPVDLNDHDLYSPSAPLTRIASEVVLEITERASLHVVSGLATKVIKLRKLGFQLAIDELGAGYAGLSALSQLEPNFVKLDRSLIHGVDTSSRKRSIVSAMVRLCAQQLFIRAICVGVETVAERDALAGEGCFLFQGFLFARPGPAFPVPKW